MSDILYKNLVQAGAPVGALQITARTLRSANGTGIEVLGCSRCSVSFLGLRTEFPIIICSLVAGTDAIIGTDVLGSVLDIKNGLLFARGGASLQLHRRDSALSGRVFTVGHFSRSSGSGVLSRDARGVFGIVIGRLKTISSSSSIANAASACLCILAASRCDFLRLFFMADLTITTWQSSTVLKNA